MRLNRLNLRKIDEIIDSIKFPETWTLQEQIEKAKHVFANIGSKYFDEELLTLYMMIRNELKIKDAQRLSQRTFSKQSKTKRIGTISEQQLEKRSEKPAQQVPIGLTSYINLEECFCY